MLGIRRGTSIRSKNSLIEIVDSDLKLSRITSIASTDFYQMSVRLSAICKKVLPNDNIKSLKAYLASM